MVPVLGHFKQAFLAAAPRAGERALVIAEEFAFQQGFGQRAAVQGHKGAVFAWSGLVQGMRQQLLAGAAFAMDVQGRVRIGETRGLKPQGVHARTCPQQAVQTMAGREASLTAVFEFTGQVAQTRGRSKGRQRAAQFAVHPVPGGY